MVFLFNILVTLMVGTSAHPYHVSVTEIFHNPKTSALEIEMKIFADDLELAIQHSGVAGFELSDDPQDEKVSLPVEQYLFRNFSIRINDAGKEMQMLGFELSNDEVKCYIEIKNVDQIAKIEIRNALLTEIHAEQINLTHFTYRQQTKSVKTKRNEVVATIDTSGW
jgi:hypothetical protein